MTALPRVDRPLDEAEAEAAFGAMLDGAPSDEDIAQFLVALSDRGETAAEIAGAARAMRARLIPVGAPDNAIDVCGTGGDGHHTLNVSTAVALVLPVLMGVSAAFLVGWALDPGAAAAPGSSLSIAAGALSRLTCARTSVGGVRARGRCRSKPVAQPGGPQGGRHGARGPSQVEPAAALSGVRVRITRAGTYGAAGALAGLGGFLLLGYTGTVFVGAGEQYVLPSVIAAVIGGTSLFGGRGSAWSALLGVLVIQAISSGLTLLNLSSSLRFMITGAVLAVAVIVDSLARRSRASHGRA